MFGDVPVTFEDVDAWLIAVPRIEPSSPRAAWYVRHWNVVEKIKAAKLRGDFETIVRRGAEAAPFWWSRFQWTRQAV
ncbi:hypothetical protein FSC37_09165 [Piscinibacter aquaticus]|uniref:Uncharacterized protein n=1 Tax=Piscinibacter aquaticus TaxID=392597 RepID=A0A5C6U2X3_9BURK|nr:hypothetical protein FSC37_09165 [Piscinibacter aquaticus]